MNAYFGSENSFSRLAGLGVGLLPSQCMFAYWGNPEFLLWLIHSHREIFFVSPLRLLEWRFCESLEGIALD